MNEPVFASKERLTEVIESAEERAPWLVPIYAAVRDHGAQLVVVPQGAGPFKLPPTQPVILLVGDDLHDARGPAAFDHPSIATGLAQAAGVVLVSSAPSSAVYGCAAKVACISRRGVVIIETRPEREFAWVSFLDKTAPGVPRLVSTIRHGRA